jgi:hypothetical protein
MADSSIKAPGRWRDSVYADRSTFAYLAILTAVLVAIGWVGLQANEANRVSAWLVMLTLMTAFIVITGKAITNSWRGILIDARNRMSLSRLQILAWTVVVLSAIFAAAMSNVTFGWESPLNIDIPEELWIVMGISTASLVAAPAVLSTKSDKVPAPSAVTQTREELRQQGYAENAENVPETTLIVRNSDLKQARWADLFKGDEVGNAATVDFAKLQMFFFTFVLVVAYGTALGAMFRDAGPITALPDVREGMYVLLGISHTGYLASKAVPHTQEVSSVRTMSTVQSVDTENLS